MSDRGLGASLTQALQERRQSGKLAEALKGLVARGAEVDRAFDRYIRKSIPWREHHEGPAPIVANVDKRAMSEAEVLVLWARIDGFRGANAARAFERLRRAAVVAPDDADILFWTARRETLMGQPLEAEGHLRAGARAATFTRESAARARNAYLDDKTGASWPTDERKKRAADAFERLGEIATTATEHNAVAIYHLIKTGVARAVGPAGRACGSPELLVVPAHVRRGHVPKRRGRERRRQLGARGAVAAPDGAPERIVQTLTRNLERYRAGGQSLRRPGCWHDAVLARLS